MTKLKNNILFPQPEYNNSLNVKTINNDYNLIFTGKNMIYFESSAPLDRCIYNTSFINIHALECYKYRKNIDNIKIPTSYLEYAIKFPTIVYNNKNKYMNKYHYKYLIDIDKNSDSFYSFITKPYTLLNIMLDIYGDDHPGAYQMTYTINQICTFTNKILNITLPKNTNKYNTISYYHRTKGVKSSQFEYGIAIHDEAELNFKELLKLNVNDVYVFTLLQLMFNSICDYDDDKYQYLIDTYGDGKFHLIDDLRIDINWFNHFLIFFNIGIRVVYLCSYMYDNYIGGDIYEI